MSRWRHLKTGLLWFAFLLPIALHGSTVWRRPHLTEINRQPLFQGIIYSRRTRKQPRPNIIHIIDIDLTTAGLRPLVTPVNPQADLKKYGTKSHRAVGQKTSAFLQTHGLQLAVNANFFSPFKEVTLWNYYPRPGEPVNLMGLSMSNGNVVAPANPDQPPVPTLCFMNQQAVINADGTCEDNTQQAVAGNLMLLENGQITTQLQDRLQYEGKKPYSFTVAALDATGARLWLVLVDGKQPFYSEGLTVGEVTALVQELGADTALRLDGGGSTTLAVSSPRGPTLLNTPIHGKIPGQERPVGNHLGFFADPIEP
ncbi:phosphodiester glycosidase family protein [Leptothoe sp. LEGE 181152]|nr:phosphodiester glycosidase family protein [Leptothoe sp. LEGE 181152]